MKIVLCGNPNVGKTTLFNELVKQNQKVGNWAGTTVAIKSGLLVHDGKFIEITDLPGFYELNYNINESNIERISSDYLLKQDYDVIVNVIDSTNLEANLLLTIDLLNLKIPTIIALNMSDELLKKRISIDTQALEILLGTKVIPISATKKTGITELKNIISRKFSFIPDPKVLLGHGLDKQLAVLQDKTSIFNFFNELKNNNTSIFYKAKQSLIKNVQQKALSKGSFVSITEIVDKVILNKYLGFPLFVLIMYSIFNITLTIGTIFQDFFDSMAGLIFVDSSKFVLENFNAPIWLKILISDSIGGSIQVIISFLPILFVFFVLVGILEQSGYMARISFLSDRVMSYFGLNGKSLIPMIIGFGCTVPSTMASRIIDDDKQRKLTILVTHFISCSARFSVYVLFIAVFFREMGSLLLLILYLFGIFLALITALFFKKLLLEGSNKFTIVELPRYQFPSLTSLSISSAKKLNSFIKRAGKVIIPMIILITLLNSFTFSGIVNKDTQDKTFLALIGKVITPILSPLGLKQDNWAASVGIFTGILAKEAVIGTITSLYSQDAEIDLSAKLEPTFFYDGITENTVTMLTQLKDLVTFNYFAVEEPEEPVPSTLEQSMLNKFNGMIGAFAYLLFFMIYSPCIAALGSIKQETSNMWMILSFVTSTFLAYVISSLFYQIMTVTTHPVESLYTIAILLVVSSLLFFGSKKFKYLFEK